MSATTACLHCGAPVAAAGGRRVRVDGGERLVCSAGCEQVVRTIVADGLTDFYRFRDQPGSAPELEQAEPDRWAAYERAALQKEFVAEEPDGSRRARLLLSGVRCAACVWLIERAIGGLPGVRGITVDPVTGRADLHWDPERARLRGLLAQLARLGYTPHPYVEDEVARAAVRERRQALKRLIVAGLGMMQVLSYAVALYAGAFQAMDPGIQQFLRLVSLLVATPVVFYSGAPFFQGAWRGLSHRTLGMDVPVALAIGAAYTASVWHTLAGRGEVYFDSATMFVFLLSAARFLEMAGRHRALSLTDALARHLPRTALRVSPEGPPATVAVTELEPGDRVLVPPGKAVPVDGILESETGRIDESLLTGEARAVSKQVGDPVFAGSVNLFTAARIRVTRLGAETTLAQISRLVGEASRSRPHLLRLADRVASGFVLGLLLFAMAVGAAWWYVAADRAFDVVLAVLVVSCPCALAIAMPSVYTVAMAKLARGGFLVRRPGALEDLATATDVLFDKTGTLTEPGARVQRVASYGRLGAAEALELAAMLEAQSEHPLARAFPPPSRTPAGLSVEAVPGSGLEASLDGRHYRIGRAEFAGGHGTVPETLGDGDSVQRVVYLGDDEGLLAAFTLEEPLRNDAQAAVDDLRRAGLEPAIASGDSPAAVRALAQRLGIATCHADLKPADKLALLRGLQSRGRSVVMVGDGINDSPVLAGADVSVAMGTGTALAQHAADCVLVAASLTALPGAVRLARLAMRRVRQNFAWALGYNLVAIPLAASGLLEPWMAALGMSASSLLVTFNALRLNGGARAEQGPGTPAGQGAAIPARP